MSCQKKFLLFSLLATLICSCDNSEGDRFLDQESAFTFESTTSKFVAYGASAIDSSNASSFRCPSISGMSSESNLTVFYAQANSMTPHFTLDTMVGIRGDTNGGFGFSIQNLPIGMLDLYERCNSTSYEKLMTACPEGYEVVEECGDGSKKECILVWEGTHQLVVHSTILDDTQCVSGSMDRSPYASSVSQMAYACDAFAPMVVPAVVSGETPRPVSMTIDDETQDMACCDEDVTQTFEFCLKLCGCRRLTVEIIPKEGTYIPYNSKTEPVDNDDNSGNSPVGEAENDELMSGEEDIIRIAVVSNVEGNEESFKKLINSINSMEENIDMVVNIGNLTNGSESKISRFKKIINEGFHFKDGQLDWFFKLLAEGTGEPIYYNSTCQSEDGQICCNEKKEDGYGRLFPTMCNALFSKVSFMTGMGEDEIRGAVSAHQTAFGPSYTSTVIGKVQIVILDTAEASVNDVEREWLDSVLPIVPFQTCNIPAPTLDILDGNWPMLHDCHKILGIEEDQAVTCEECIQEEAYCIPPDKDKSVTEYGPENCVCVPARSKICGGTLTCSSFLSELFKENGESGDGESDEESLTGFGTEGACLCTRDEDCGVGGSCVNNLCVDPIRLVFSYTPLFDEFGSRNNSFSSKREAAGLLSLFLQTGVDAIFSGRVLDYASISKGGIPMYITGGGGADMASFASKKHHWLMITIPGGYTHPDPANMTVSVMEF